MQNNSVLIFLLTAVPYSVVSFLQEQKSKNYFYAIPLISLIDGMNFQLWTGLIYFSWFLFIPIIFFFFQEKNQQLLLITMTFTVLITNFLLFLFPTCAPNKEEESVFYQSYQDKKIQLGFFVINLWMTVLYTVHKGLFENFMTNFFQTKQDDCEKTLFFVKNLTEIIDHDLKNSILSCDSIEELKILYQNKKNKKNIEQLIENNNLIAIDGVKQILIQTLPMANTIEKILHTGGACPSLHCSFSFSAVFLNIILEEVSYSNVFFNLWGLAICVSTITFKQHYVLDFVASFALSLAITKLCIFFF